MEFENRGMRECENDGMVEGWNDGMMELWNDGMMEWWSGGVVELWNDGIVEWWNDGTQALDIHAFNQSCIFFSLISDKWCLSAVKILKIFPGRIGRTKTLTIIFVVFHIYKNAVYFSTYRA
jgi:hypothetical protein